MTGRLTLSLAFCVRVNCLADNKPRLLSLQPTPTFLGGGGVEGTWQQLQAYDNTIDAGWMIVIQPYAEEQSHGSIGGIMAARKDEDWK